MNNAIKYIICASASLALGFGSGYFFKAEKDKISSQSKAAQFEADSIQYASDSFRQISSDIYSAEQSADRISKGIKEIKQSNQEMMGGPLQGVPGSEKVGGLDDLFKDKKEEENQEEQKEENKDYEQSSNDSKYVPVREITKVVRDAVEHMQSNIDRAYKHLSKIHEHIQSGKKALANAKEIADSVGSSDVPSVPDIPVLPKSDSEKKYEQK